MESQSYAHSDPMAKHETKRNDLITPSDTISQSCGRGSGAKFEGEYNSGDDDGDGWMMTAR